MERNDLELAYSVITNDLIKKAYDIPFETWQNMFHTPKQDENQRQYKNEQNQIKVDEGKFMYFTSCYELTMTYLAANQDIQDKCRTGGIEQEQRQELMACVEKMKQNAAALFNHMKEIGIYFDQPNMAHYCQFWDALYNGTPCDVNQFKDNIENVMDETREVLMKGATTKMHGKEFCDACFNFASMESFAKMSRLAVDVEHRTMHQFEPSAKRAEELVVTMKAQQKITSALTPTGFVTDGQYLLEGEKHRKNRAGSVDRNTKGTPGITNMAAKEDVYVGFKGIKICKIPQKRTFGCSKLLENGLDTVRGWYEAYKIGNKPYKAAEKIKDNFTKIMSFIHIGATHEEMLETAEDIVEKMLDKFKEIKPQGKEVEANDILLRKLFLEVKNNENLLTQDEKKELELIDKGVEILSDTTKDMAKQAIKGNIEYESLFNDLHSAMIEYGIDIFDTYRYGGFDMNQRCDGSKEVAQLKLVTHLMSYGEKEIANNPVQYQEAMDLLEHMHGDTISDIKENLEYEQSRSQER